MGQGWALSSCSCLCRIAAFRPAAWVAGLGSANECAHELAFHVRSDVIHRDTGFGQEHPCVFDVVDAGRLKLYVCKAGGDQLRSIVGLFQRSGNATDPKEHALADGSRDLTAHHNVRHGEAAPRPEDAEGFTEDTGLI